MRHQLSSNIRALRKAKHLTQEQLAEAMHVTVGAVSKWELGQSLPEINMLINLADFFDSSIDSLLGYELHLSNQEDVANKLKDYRDSKEYELGFKEFEKAYQKYPNSFVIIYEGASIYQLYGVETKKVRETKRAIELFERSMLLLDQNNNPEVSEGTIYVSIAEAYMAIGDTTAALDILTKHNPHGINNALIGMIYATSNQAKKALHPLSSALLNNLCEQIKITVGFVNAFASQKEYKPAIDVLNWQQTILNGLKTPGQVCCFDKTKATLYSALAIMHYLNGEENEAKDSLLQAKSVAIIFDQNPVYHCKDMKFYYGNGPATVYDDMGETAIQAIEKALLDDDVPQGLINIWKEVLLDEKAVHKTILQK